MNVELKKGQPEPQIEWFKNDKTVKSDDHLVLADKGDLHSLTISSVVPDDSGVYKVKAISKAGSLERTFDVQVAGNVPYHST